MPEPDAETGSVKGLVTDDAIQPIEGVMVGLLPGEASATTDPTGAFVLNGIAPGDYTVVAQKLGYEEDARKITVVVGEVAEVRLSLVPLEVEEAHYEMEPKKGFWTLAVATLVAVPSTGVANSEHRVNVDIKKNWNTTLVELVWKYSNPGQASTPGAWWNMQATPKGGSSRAVGEVFGKSAPIRAEFHPEMVYRGDGFTGSRGEFPVEAYNLNMYVFPLGLLTDETQPVVGAGFSGSRSRGVGTSFQQPFDMYISKFYFAPPASDYTAVPEQ